MYAFNRLEMEAQKVGGSINYDKTKYMETGRPTKEKCIRKTTDICRKLINLNTWEPLLLIITLRRK
jgi:hypothetical protein